MANMLRIILLLLTVRQDISTQAMDTSSWTPLAHSAILDESQNYHLFWDFDEDNIIFEVQVKTLGYFGLGISPNGGMKDSDIVIGGVDDVTGVYLTDRHAVGNAEPLLDKRQDWTLISGSQNNSHTTVRFWRKLNTCDDEDREIRSETVRVIWAYHPEDWQDAGSRYHGSQRGSKSMFLLNPQRVLPEIPEDSFAVDFLNTDVNVPSDDTTYWCQVFPSLSLPHKHHAIKFEPLIKPGNEGTVHHIVLFSCSVNITGETDQKAGRCWGETTPDAWKNCDVVIFAWAIGGGSFHLPGHVGYPFGFEEDPKSFLLQTHYDNPRLRSDVFDSSGIRLTMTPTLRQHDAATLFLGDVSWRNMVIPPFAESFRIDGHCLPQCLSQQGMGNETEINIFATFLHAHLLSDAIKFRHIRNGVEQRPISVDDNYDFNFQETRVVEPEVRVQPGDHLITECYYRSTSRKSVTFGGASTHEEMCETFAMYYPRIPLTNCLSMLPMEQVAKMADVQIYGPNNWTISEPEVHQGKNLYDVLVNETDWTKENTRSRAQELSTSFDNPVMPLCDGNSESSSPKLGEPTKPPRITREWKEEPKCVVSGVLSISGFVATIQSVTTAVLLLMTQHLVL